TYTWDGPLTGDWGTANWSSDTDEYPPPDWPVDDEIYTIQAVIDTADALVTVEAAHSVASLQIAGTAEVHIADVGGLNVAGNVSVAPGATLTVDGTLAAAVLNTAGTTVITAGLEDLQTINVTGGSTSLAGGALINLNVSGGSLTASDPLLFVNESMTITGGSTSLAGGDAANLSVTGGQLSTSADLTVEKTLTLGATSFAMGPFDLDDLTLSGSDVLNDGVISFSGTLTVTGEMNAPNTNLAASGVSVLTLDTTEAATLGTLTLDTAGGGQALDVSDGPSSVSFDRLTGNGMLIWGGLAGGFSIAGTLAPGNSIGWIDVDGTVTMETGSTYEWELSPAGPDEFSAAALDLVSAESWTLKLVDAGLPLGEVSGDVVLAEYGTLVGDSLGNMVLDDSETEHWLFTDGVERVANDSTNSQIVLQGLQKILALQWKTDADGAFEDAANWFNRALPD
ncbi:hypothetical protein LCGC14_2643710, partial [marine sediment metagenome]